jgi:hypothetical protein
MLVIGEATLTRRRCDKYDAVPLGRCASEQSARQQSLVVGVGVEGHECELLASACHGFSTASYFRLRASE